MTIVYLGGQTIGSIIPAAFALNAKFKAFLDIDLPSASLDLAAALGINASLNASISVPSFAIKAVLDAELSGHVLIGLQLLTEGAFGLSLSASLDANLTLLANLNLKLGSLNAGLAFSLDLALAFGSSGIHLYQYAGAANNLGSDVTGQLSSGVPGGTGGGEQVYSLVLVTRDSVAWTAMQKVFKTT